jgi:hypothetical protein
MATFSFEPNLFRKLNNEERGIIRHFKGSKKNDGTIPVSEQFVYRIVTAEFVYRTTFLRKVASENDKIKILKRRKKPLNDLERANLRSQTPPDWKQLVWEVERESYRVNCIRETVALEEKLEINTQIKRGRYDWSVEDVKLVPVKGTEVESVETVSYSLHEGHPYGDRLIVKVTQLDSPVNRVISKLCRLQNGGNSCISGQKHETVVTCHASREPIPAPFLNDTVFKLDKLTRLNRRMEIQPLNRGDWTEETFFDAEGKYEGRELVIAAESENRGWKEYDGEFETLDLGVSEKYKPLSLPSDYRDSDDIPDQPVIVNLTEAEKKLRAMGFL